MNIPGIFVAQGEQIEEYDPNNTVEVNGEVVVEDLQKDIDALELKEARASELEPVFLESDPERVVRERAQVPRNMLAASTKLTNKMAEQDNMLKYQISDNKEENELIEDLLGDEPSDQNSKSSKPKDGEMISTDAAN